MKVIHKGDEYHVNNGEPLLVEVDGVLHPAVGVTYNRNGINPPVGDDCLECPLHKYRKRFDCSHWIVGGCIKSAEEDLG